jgi:hypothetical protein
MPTDKPRVNVTLDQADYDLLSTLARQQKRSRADMLRDLFETMRPVLERVAVVSEAAQRAQATARQGMIESAEKAEAELLPMVQKALGQFDMFLADVQAQADGGGRQQTASTGGAAAAPPPPTPVPVITGVRSSRTGGKTPRKVVRQGPRKVVRQGPRKVAGRSARRKPK